MASDHIVVNVDVGETRLALIEGGMIVELNVERKRERSMVGNVYHGKVSRVISGMQAAFIDVGIERAAFLAVADIIRPDDFDMLVPDAQDHTETRPPRRIHSSTPIRDVLKEGQNIIVQVAKGPLGTKGARVTSHISLAGRYLVYMPTQKQIGISKRISDPDERARLREIMKEIKPAIGGIITRTAADGASRKDLQADARFLEGQWEEILRNHEKTSKVSLLYEEPDLVLRAARDSFNSDIAKIIVDDKEQHGRLNKFINRFAPSRTDDVEFYQGREPIFDAFGIEDEITRALGRRVPLPSGGFLVIDQAEALTAIDVNTGKFTGGKDLEETITKTNLEAVREIAYQLRFRNLGGLIVVDFIDMDRPSNRDRVYKALKEELERDRAKTTAMRISELGLVEMTRKRTRESLGRTMNQPCFYCDGTGQILSGTSVAYEILRELRREYHRLSGGKKVIISVHPDVASIFKNEESSSLKKVASSMNLEIKIEPVKGFHFEQFEIGTRGHSDRKDGK